MARPIAFLVFPGFDLQDLSGPLEAFHWAEQMIPGSYLLTVTSLEGGVIMSAPGLEVMTHAVGAATLDTLIVVGGGTSHEVEDAALSQYVKSASTEARRTASICTGAFHLAAAGCLDGLAATTHWRWAATLQKKYPAVRVDGDRIFVHDGNIWTSAGITSGIDMSLAMIEEDLGKDIARSIARMLVVYYRRPGGQDQFSTLLENEPDEDRIRRALTFAREHLEEPLPVERLAEAASLSVRQFGRAFLASTGTTPAKAIDKLRAEMARPRVEDGRETIDEIARAVGFSDPNRMRQSFLRAFGHTPQTIRRLARDLDPAPPTT